MKRWLTLALALFLLLAVRSTSCFADDKNQRCPNGCPRFHVERWSGGTYDTDDESLFENVYGYNIGYNYTSGRVEPKCLEPGSITYHCSVCNYTQTEEIPPLGHDFVVIESREATCTTGGYEKRQCSRHTVRFWGDGSMSINGCAVEQTTEFDPLGHDYQTGDLISPATCTSAAVYESVCIRCGESGDPVSVGQPLGHEYQTGDLISPATCTSAAVHESVCTRCGESGDPVSVGQPLGHTFVKELLLSPATCTYPYATYLSKCSRCGESGDPIIESQPIEHDFQKGNLISPANCTSPAFYETKCSRCGESGGGIIDGQPLGHTFVKTLLLSPATCTYPYATYFSKCSRCGESGDAIVESQPFVHDFQKGNLISPANCTSPAFYETKCSRCGESGSGIIDGQPLGHAYVRGLLILPATCTYPYATYYCKCSRCNKEDRETVYTYVSHTPEPIKLRDGRCGLSPLYHDVCTFCGTEVRAQYPFGPPGPHYFRSFTIPIDFPLFGRITFKQCRYCSLLKISDNLGEVDWTLVEFFVEWINAMFDDTWKLAH